MNPTPERRDELIAAAAANALTDEERRELDAARLVDPSIDPEIVELCTLIASLAETVPTWDDSLPSAALRDRVTGIAAPHETGPHEPQREAPHKNAPHEAPHETAPLATVTPLRRRVPLIAAAAAACLALGLGVGIGALASPGEERMASGAPGELGALESVDFLGEPDGVRVDGGVVAHTWGTETILEVEGLPVGASYSVVVVDGAGEEHASGSFAGSEAVIDCRMNVSTLRGDAARVEIVDSQGATVASADLPGVEF
ncbi:hypothetical protein ACEXQD_11750 [Herbiconiux sp. P15]|uniref:hypothetical protein n=1 Tax=Herbiconiux liukaitaii TaxID=3342799 RepID=UPI0035B7F5A0